MKGAEAVLCGVTAGKCSTLVKDVASLRGVVLSLGGGREKGWCS